MKLTTIAIALLIALFFTSQSSATIIKSTEGLSDPVTLITFDEANLRSGRTVTDQYSDQGVTFSPKLYQMNLRHSFLPNLEGGTLMNRRYLHQVDPFYISFNEVQNSAAFSLVSLLPRDATFTTYLNGEVLEQQTLSANLLSKNNYYHFYNESGFDKISVDIGEDHESCLKNYFDTIKIDNLQMGAVPEPSTYALMLFAVAGLFFFGQRKKNMKLRTI